MPDKKLTDAEIVKALECCTNTDGPRCGECEFFDGYDLCIDNLQKDTLDLINHLQAENSKLKKSNRNWRRKVQRLRNRIGMGEDK